MLNVLVIINNPLQASYRLRIAALVGPLQARGITLHIRQRPAGWLARRRLLRTASEFDAVILQRKLLDPADCRILRGNARKIYFDVDDAVMVGQNNPGLISRWRTGRRFAATARSLDLAVTGNKNLAGYFAPFNCPTQIIPTTVDPGHYCHKHHAPTDHPTLVWIGSRSTLGYLQNLVPVLADAARQVPGLRLITIADATLENPPLPVEHIPWSADTEAAALVRGDIGLAPTPDDTWTRGKCGFKIIQYMASALPAIASPIGANAEIVVADQTGLLPADHLSWVNAIVRLAADAPLRQRLGQAAHQRMMDHYSNDIAADAWAEILK